MKVLMFWLHQEEIKPVEAEPVEARNSIATFYNDLKKLDDYDPSFDYGISSFSETDFY